MRPIRPAPAPRPLAGLDVNAADSSALLVDSYRRLADVFHLVLAEQSLDRLLDRVADALGDLIPHDTLTIYGADEAQRVLTPLLVRDIWADEIMQSTTKFGEGLTGWAVEHREPLNVAEAHRDPRVKFVPGTPEDEPESLICVPLVARDAIKGALNMYRLGEDARFSEVEFELAQRFADAAALALDNAHIRERLEHQAQTDSLTGLLNHRTFHERLRRALRQASRSGETVSVLMLDLDDFKLVNDVHGHALGDDVLLGIADALRSVVREGDSVYRLGGDEFATIMASCSHDDAHRLATRVLELLTSLDFGPAGTLTVSIGLAQGPEHAMNARELAACAEAAMMTAKAKGKNQIVRFDDGEVTRPGESRRDIRSMAHMKMLQSLGGKLNRLNDVREIGDAIAEELRKLVDYHNCRVSIVDGDDVVPIAFRGAFTGGLPTTLEVLACKVGEGITGHVAGTGQTLLIGDAASSELGIVVPGTETIQESLIAAPVCYGSRVTGVIVISKLGLDQFDEDDARIIEILAGHAAIALENARLYEAQRREAESATALLEFSRELAVARGFERTLERIVERTAGVLGSENVTVWLQEPGGGDLRGRAQTGLDDAERAVFLESRFPAELVEAALAVSVDPFVLRAEDLQDIDGVPDDLARDFAIAPMRVDESRWGCIAVALPHERDFDERDLRLLGGLAHQAQLAIANADSFHTLEDTFLATLEALTSAIDSAGVPSAASARAVADLAVRVADQLGCDRRVLGRVELGALFHDIGNVGVPARILTKPGRLTPAERATMERHVTLGERIVEPIDRLRPVAPIVRHSHERWDGGGYPDRLAGDAIPLEARIIHACSAFTAMRSDRPYRNALPHEEAVRRLREEAGRQFDPSVVDALLRLVGDEPV